MKRLLCLCLCAGLTFGAVGCGNTTEPTEQTAQQTQEEEQKTEQEETKEETKQIQEQSPEATDFLNSINDVLKYAEKPTLDTWERNVEKKAENDETIKYKYRDGEEYIELWYHNTGIILVSYYGNPSSDLFKTFAVPTVQSIKYFEKENAENVAEQLHLFSPVEGDSTAVGANGKIYTFSFIPFDETHINSILMIG